MKIIDDLLSTLDYRATLRDIRLGPFWTATVTINCGLASTSPMPDHHHSGASSPVKDAGNLMKKSVLELTQMARSES